MNRNFAKNGTAGALRGHINAVNLEQSSKMLRIREEKNSHLRISSSEKIKNERHLGRRLVF
ncbi:MAG: hypothetical protein ACFFCW_29840, partial [Candidatus Hodarchaeota archaeon]